MKLSEFIEKIYEKTDLNSNDLLSVSRCIPQYYTRILSMIHEHMQKLEELRCEYDILHSSKIKYYTEDYNIDFRSNGLKETYVKGEKDISELNMRMSKNRNIILTLENLIKYLQNLQLNIKNIIDYEKFKSGV